MLGSSLAWCLGQMRPPTIYRHQWIFLEPWRVLTIQEDSIIPYTLYVQEISRILQKALDSSHVFHHSVEMCQLLQASLKLSTLFSLMAKYRSLHKLPMLYISPGETHLKHHVTLGSLRHLRPTQAPQDHLGTLGPLRYLKITQAP